MSSIRDARGMSLSLLFSGAAALAEKTATPVYKRCRPAKSRPALGSHSCVALSSMTGKSLYENNIFYLKPLHRGKCSLYLCALNGEFILISEPYVIFPVAFSPFCGLDQSFNSAFWVQHILTVHFISDIIKITLQYPLEYIEQIFRVICQFESSHHLVVKPLPLLFAKIATISIHIIWNCIACHERFEASQCCHKSGIHKHSYTGVIFVSRC